MTKHPTRLIARYLSRLAGPAAAGFTRAEVAGMSMAPALLPGDRLLVVRLGRPKPGQVVAAADPREPGRLLVKRVARVGPNGVELEGDNHDASTDSRHFGPVRAAAVRGQVVYRYAPAGRAGWWPALNPPARTPPARTPPARTPPGSPVAGR